MIKLGQRKILKTIGSLLLMYRRAPRPIVAMTLGMDGFGMVRMIDLEGRREFRLPRENLIRLGTVLYDIRCEERAGI